MLVACRASEARREAGRAKASERDGNTAARAVVAVALLSNFGERGSAEVLSSRVAVQRREVREIETAQGSSCCLPRGERFGDGSR